MCWQFCNHYPLVKRDTTINKPCIAEMISKMPPCLAFCQRSSTASYFSLPTKCFSFTYIVLMRAFGVLDEVYQYLGKRKQPLHSRTNLHGKMIKDRKTQLPVGKYFSLNNHSISDLPVLILSPMLYLQKMHWGNKKF